MVREDHESTALSQGLRSLDGVVLVVVFTRRALVMRSVPRVLQGPYIAAVWFSLQEASQAQQDGHQARLSRNVVVETSKRWFGSETAFGKSIAFVRGRRVDRVVAAKCCPWGRSSSSFRQKAST